MKIRTPFSLLAALVLITGVLAFAGNARAQLAIYRLEFDKTGPSINYGFYDEGYVIAEAAGGPATWFLTFRDKGTFQNHYITIEEFGSLFYANKDTLTRAVVSAAAATGTPQTTFLLIGDLSRDVESDNISVEVAGNMNGHAISADDESELPFDSREGNVGYAGSSEIKATFQTERSNAASRDRLTIEEALADIVEMFESRGFTEFTVDDPDDGTDDGNGDGTDGDGTDGDDDGTDGDGTTAEDIANAINNGGGGGGNN